MDYTNKSLGLRVQTQIPLDIKQYSISEDTLKNLGPNNNLAYTYIQGLIVYCVQEKTRWEWREVVGVEIGLIPINFTYPNGIIAFGIDYSNRTFNFFPFGEIPVITVPDATATVKGILKLTNDIGGTADLPTTPTALHKTTNESFTGIKSSTNSGTGQNSGIKLINNATGGAGAILDIDVNGAHRGILVTNGVSSNLGIQVAQNSTLFGGAGVSIVVAPTSNSCGLRITGTGAVENINTSSQSGSNIIAASVDGNSIVSVIGIGSTIGNGFTFVGKNFTTTTFTVDKLGNIIGNTFVKTGGTSSQFLKADGSVSTIDGSETKINAGTNVTITGLGTTATPYVINSTGGGSVIQVTTVTISSPAMDTGYGIPTGLTVSNTIWSVVPFLYCNNANNGYNVGDMITAPTPETNDSGGLTDSGIGVRFNASVYDYVSFSVNNRVDINVPHALDGTSGIPIGNPVTLTSLADWAVKLVITYI